MPLPVIFGCPMNITLLKAPWKFGTEMIWASAVGSIAFCGICVRSTTVEEFLHCTIAWANSLTELLLSLQLLGHVSGCAATSRALGPLLQCRALVSLCNAASSADFDKQTARALLN